MVRLFAVAAISAYVVSSVSIFASAAPATRRQLGNLECNIARGEIVFHVAQLAATVNSLTNATDLMAANNTTDTDIQAMQTGAQGAGAAVKQILLGLVNGDPATPELRDSVGKNLTVVNFALLDLSSSDNTTSMLLAQAGSELTNAALAGNGVLNNCK